MLSFECKQQERLAGTWQTKGRFRGGKIRTSPVAFSGDKLLLVSMTSPSPIFSSIQWHRRLFYHRYQRYQRWINAGNSNASYNLPAGITTLPIKQLDEYQSAYKLKLMFQQVYIATQYLLNKMLINFLYQNFSYLSPLSLAPVINHYIWIYYRVFVKIWNGSYSIWYSGRWVADLWKKPEAEKLVSDYL